MSINQDRLTLINSGLVCATCQRPVRAGEKSGRFIEDGQMRVRHRGGCESRPAGEFRVGTRVRLARPMTVNGRSDPFMSQGSTGTVRVERWHDPRVYPTLIQVAWGDRGMGYWCDRECLEIVYTEDTLPDGWALCSCGCGAVYDESTRQTVGRISPVTGEWTAAANGRIPG